MVALLVVAASVGLSNLAAAIGFGAGGVTPGMRIRIAIIFGVLEAGMPVAGLALGHGVAYSLGRHAHWFAGALLAAIGGYTVIAARRLGKDRARGSTPSGSAGADQGQQPRGARPRSPRLVALIVTGVALSLDNLVAGFALGTFRVGLLAGAAVFGVVSVAESLAGLELGARIGKRAGEQGELIGGATLIGVGAAIAFGALG